MKKSAIVLFFAALLSVTAFAQNVQEGINHLYAERYQSAKATFEKLVAANPNNLEATYWLGQTHIASNNTAAAKSLYDKALASNGNAPLILVGAGHIDLMEGRSNEARQRFEAAITASRGKKGDDPAVINAIARANIDAKTGDVAYAITKLTALAQSTPNYAETYVNLGNAYRKTHAGGMAVQNYRKAAQLNPSLAAVANYRTARLYRTQNNWDVVTENLNEAIKADPRFAPAYEMLYVYYLTIKRDFPTAEQYANKYISSSDPSVENEYMKAQTLFVQDKFTEAIAIGKNIIAQTNNNPNPRVYRLLSHSYLGARDTATACNYVNEFFTKVKEDDIVGADYLLHANSCGKGDPVVIRADVMKAVQMDSVLSRQINMLNDAIQNATKNGQKILEGELKLISYELRGERANKAELFQIGLPYYLGGNYQKADSLFTAYAVAFPDSIYGYYWAARAKGVIDSTMEQGLAIPDYAKSLQIAETDKVRFKSQGLSSASTLAAYYNNIKKDRESAIKYLQKGLEFDPGNAQLQNFLKALQPPAATPRQQTTKPAPKTTQKTSTSANQAKGTKTTTKKKG
ncbi:MAG TPA: tetratricopeptide repeat protein [Flavisolibacter sp.]